MVFEDRHGTRNVGTALGLRGRGSRRDSRSQRLIHLLESPPDIPFEAALQEGNEDPAEPFGWTNLVRLGPTASNSKMCSPSNSRGRTRRPSHRSSRLGTTFRTFGRNRIGRVPEAPRRTSKREPSTAFPRTLRMNGFQSGNDSKSVSTCHTRSTGPPISVSVRNSSIALSEQAGRLQLLRDLLDGLLNVRWLAGARAHELAAAEQEHDHLRYVDAVDEAGELLGLVLDLLQAEGNRDRVQVDLCPEVRGRDNVLDLDLRVLLDWDPGSLDLLRHDLDRLLHVLEALRPGAADLAAAEEEGRGLRLLQAVDQPGELLRLVLRAAEGEGDGLEVQFLAEGGRCDHVLNLDFS